MPIQIEDLSYSYESWDNGVLRSIPILRGLNLDIPGGEFLGIMGRTGCGKTTLAQLMAGLLVPQGGRILLGGDDINGPGYPRSRLRRTLGLVFQFPEYQLFETTVEKDAAFGLKHSGLDKDEIRARVKEALETMGFSFEAVKGLPPAALSGGEKRRAAIAGVLAAGPEILILDEPIAGLDPPGRVEFLRLLKDLNGRGITIIMISHNADALAESADRLVVLDRGRLAADGTPGEVFRDMGRMEALGLDVSASGKTAAALAARGLNIPPGITRYNELLEAVKTRYTPRKGAAS